MGSVGVADEACAFHHCMFRVIAYSAEMPHNPWHDGKGQ